MAAFRNGIKTVIIPADNNKDLEEIDQTVRKALQFVLVERADQVLSTALLPHTAAPAERPIRNLRSEVFANLLLPIGDCLKPLFDPMAPFLLCLAYPCLCLLQLQNPNLQPLNCVRINGRRRL